MKRSFNIFWMENAFDDFHVFVFSGFNSSPLKKNIPKGKYSLPNHHFSGAMLNFQSLFFVLGEKAGELFEHE